MFINDMCGEIQCELLVFAGDIKIFKSISTRNDCIQLQNQLSRIADWCTVNKADINIGKCKIMSFTKTKQYINYNYNINITALERTFTIKDLGVRVEFCGTYATKI